MSIRFPSSSAVSIRAAKSEDAAAILACVTAAYKQYIPLIGKPPGPMLDDYGTNIANHDVFIAEQESDLAGILVLIRQSESLLLDNIAVNPGFQGQGIGRQLMVFAEECAKKWSFDIIELYTHEVMTENVIIYTKMGYIESERKTVNGYDRIYMQKTLCQNPNQL